MLPKRWDYFPRNDLIQMYRRVFSSPHGLEVLSHMLYDLGVFQANDGEHDIVLKEYGQHILDILSGSPGPVGGPDDYSIQVFVKQLMRQKLEKETPDD